MAPGFNIIMSIPTGRNYGNSEPFSYAKKELSQDAVICWLVSCATEATESLRKCGLAFVRTLFQSGVSDETGGVPVLGPDGEKMAPYNGQCEVQNVWGPCTHNNRIDVYFQAQIDGSEKGK